MSALSDSLAQRLGALFMLNDDATGIGDAGGLLGSVVPGVFWFSLHTADPGVTGTQLTSEVTYFGYARVSKTRSATDFTQLGRSLTNATTLTFSTVPDAESPETATHIMLGGASSGAGDHFLRAALPSALVLSSGVTPTYAPGILAFTW